VLHVDGMDGQASIAGSDLPQVTLQQFFAPWRLPLCRGEGVVRGHHAPDRPGLPGPCKLNVAEKNREEVSGMRGKAALLISEGGRYKLTLRSDKPDAHLFQDWVTCHVLPAIRKDGA
jgi:hypothetical protein